MSSTATRRPSRTIPTRSATCSTSASTCEDMNTVRARARAFPGPGRALLLHQRVEAAGRLVQDQQLRVVHERRDSPTFCLLPLERSPIAAAEIEAEPLAKLVDPVRRDSAAQGAEKLDQLRAVAFSYRLSSPGR